MLDLVQRVTSLEGKLATMTNANGVGDKQQQQSTKRKR